MASSTAPAGTSTLATFPLELLQQIATDLPTLRDILSFSTVSHRFYSAVNSDTNVYRHLFHRIYDPPIPSLTSLTFSPASSWGSDTFDYKSAFISRHLLLRTLRTSTQPPGAPELQLLRTLLLESPSTRDDHAGGGDGRRVGSKNLTTVIPRSLPKPIITGAASSFMQHPRLLLALQLLLLPIRRLGDEEVARVRRTAYATGRLENEWLDLRMLNAVGLLHAWHLDRKSPSGVFYQKDMLKEGELVGWWEGRLGDMALRGQGNEEDVDEEVERDDDNVEEKEEDHNDLRDMPTRWFGSYTYKHYMFDPGMGESELGETGDNFLSDLRLEFRNRRFKGSGKDYKSFTIANGTIGKPVTVEGIPGWRKVRFTKHYQSHAWQYVACMLPGKNAIIGRWGYPGDPTSTGIFMWWAVPNDTGDLGSRDNRLSII